MKKITDEKLVFVNLLLFLLEITLRKQFILVLYEKSYIYVFSESF